MNEWLKIAKNMEGVVYPPGSEYPNKENTTHIDPFPINPNNNVPEKRNVRSVSPKPRPKSPINSPRFPFICSSLYLTS